MLILLLKLVRLRKHSFCAFKNKDLSKYWILNLEIKRLYLEREFEKSIVYLKIKEHVNKKKKTVT